MCVENKTTLNRRKTRSKHDYLLYSKWD